MLNEELYEITKKVSDEREAKRREGERLERVAIDLEAAEEAKKIIASLPDRLKKAARSGETYRRILHIGNALSVVNLAFMRKCLLSFVKKT